MLNEQTELEFVASAKGVILVTDVLKQKFNDNVFKTLRIVDLEKVIPIAKFFFKTNLFAFNSLY